MRALILKLIVYGSFVILFLWFVPGTYAEEIALEYTFDAPELSELKDGWWSVNMEGLNTTSNAGEPILPCRTAKILLPDVKGDLSINVIGMDEVLIGYGYRIEFGKKDFITGDDYPQGEDAPNPAIYDSDNPYPHVMYSEGPIQYLDGYRFKLVDLYPVRYLPRRGRLSYFRRMKVVITIRPAGAAKAAFPDKDIVNNQGREERIRQVIDNPGLLSQLAPKASRLTSESQQAHYDYLIITNADMKPVFERLSDQKKYRPDSPITAGIKDIEEIYAEFPGSDNQEKIRNFIRHAYENYSTRYVLLGGDVDVVPYRGMYGPFSHVHLDVPADLYYGCLDGDWDYDEDGIYGEPGDGPDGGEVDLFAEIFIGRAPVETIDEATNFVDKIIAYEQNLESTEYLKKVLLVVNNKAARTWYSEKYTEEAAKVISQFTINKLYVQDATFQKRTLMDRLNEGTHLIYHHAHGGSGSVMGINEHQIGRKLTNTDYYFILSGGCSTAQFHESRYDAVGECFVKSEYGAFGYIGNSWSGWFRNGSLLHVAFFEKLNEGMTKPGETLQVAKEAAFSGNMNDYARCMYYVANLLGDPETALAVDIDQPMAGIHAPNVLNPVKHEEIDIIGTARKGRLPASTFKNYRLEYSRGYGSLDWSAEGITLTGDGECEVDNDVLGRWDLSGLEKGMYTLRLTVTDQDGKSNGSFQRVSVVWPRPFHGVISSGDEANSVTIGDVDADGDREIFFGNFEYFDAFHHDGSRLRYWPKTFSPYGFVLTGSSLADFDNDGQLEIVNAVYGRVVVWNENGTYFDGDGDGIADWPKEMPRPDGEWWNMIGATTSIGDLNGDGKLDIVLAYLEDYDPSNGINYGKVYAWSSDGERLPGWTEPKEIIASGILSSTIAIADIDRDGRDEVAVSGNDGWFYLFDDDGSHFEGRWPFNVNIECDYIGKLAIADLNGDEQYEIIATIAREVYVWDIYGDPVFPPVTVGGTGTLGAPAVADLNNDGELEIIIAHVIYNEQTRSRYTRLYEIDNEGGFIKNDTGENWIREFPILVNPNPVLGDVDGDGQIEIVVAGSTLIYVLEKDGTDLSGWPRETGLVEPDIIAATPAIDDIDGDGYCEIVAAANSLIYVFDLPGEYNPEKIPWPMYQHDVRHTASLVENHPPVLHTIGNKTVDEGETLGFRLTVTDPDDDTLIFSAVGLPERAEFTDNGDNTASFSWRPNYYQSGKYKVTFTVSDGEFEDEETIVITVIEITTPPEMLYLRKLYSYKSGKSSLWGFYWLGRDREDGYRLNYSYRVNEGGWSKPSSSTNIRFSRIKAGLEPGNHLLEVKAIDQNWAESANIKYLKFTIKGNTPPRILYLYHLKTSWGTYFFWRGFDKEDGYRLRYSYRIDEGEWSKPSRRYWTFTQDKDITSFSVKSIDSKGLESRVRTIILR